MRIKTLDVESWKIFSKLTLEFEQGTTFLVARNGLGKTSVSQALAFAVFGGERLLGTRSNVGSAISAGAESSKICCEIVVGDQLIRVERRLSNSRGKAVVDSSYLLDGRIVNEAAVSELIRVDSGLDATELELLVFLSEMASASSVDVGSDIANSLSMTFGVDRLRSTAETLSTRAKRLEKSAFDKRKNLRNIPIDKGRAARDEYQQSISNLESQFLELRSTLDTKNREANLNAKWIEFEAQQIEYQQSEIAVRNSYESLSQLIGNSKIVELAQYQRVTREQLPLIREQISILIDGAVKARNRCETIIDLSTRLLEQVRSETGVCPVCKRPLSESDAELAREEHERTISESSQELEASMSLSDILRRLHDATSELIRVDTKTAPRAPDGTKPLANAVLAEEIAELSRKSESLTKEIDVLRTRIQISNEEELAIRGNEVLKDELYREYREEELAELNAEIMRTLADLIVSQRIEPLSIQMSKKWTEIWRTEPLEMASQGSLSKRVNGHHVPYSEFSGGEKTMANIILRLLTLELAARSTFAVFDEPLEHLDPKNRGFVTTLLSIATQPRSSIEQLIVTTYEESVTRRLQSVPNPRGTRVSYINQ